MAAPAEILTKIFVIYYLFSVPFIAPTPATDSVVLSSSLSLVGRLTVCPCEAVLYECCVMGPRLEWILPSENIKKVYYQRNDTDSEVNISVTILGNASMWLSSNTQQLLCSQLVLYYSPGNNNTEVECNGTSSSETKTLHYILADTPAAPMFKEQVSVIGQSETSVQYLLEWSQPSDGSSDLDHYEISTSGDKRTSTVFVGAPDNKTIISTHIGAAPNISIIAVNKCGLKSQPSEKHLEPVNYTSPEQQGFIIYIVSALAIIFGLLSIVLLIILLKIVFQKLRKNKEKYESSKNEGFPLLTKERNRDSS